MRGARCVAKQDALGHSARQYSVRPHRCQPHMQQMVYRWRRRIVQWDLLSLLLPSRCVLCGAAGQPGGLDLCVDCDRELPRLVDVCPQCALPWSVSGMVGRCADCLRMPPPYRGCHALCSYAVPADRMVHALKYQHQLAMGRVLGTLLARSVLAQALHQDIDVLMPVPLHPLRHAERGFNQSAEIARWVGRATGLPVRTGVLVRMRNTVAQVGLELAARRTNLRGAFGVRGEVRDQRIGLVDDVVTTGSTVAEIAATLQAAGARSVDVWCVARTPPAGD